MINSISSQQYLDDTRGLNNAYFHHIRNEERKQKLENNLVEPKVNEKTNLNEAAVLELNENYVVEPNIYSLKDILKSANVSNINELIASGKDINISNQVDEDNSDETLIIANGANVSINSEVGTDNSNNTLIVGNGAKVNINSEVGIDNGNDTLIIGNGAKVNINSEVGVDNGNDTVIIGNGAKVDINSSVGVDNSNDVLIVGNGAKVEINSSVGVDNGNDTLIIGNGAKVKINVKAIEDNSNDTIIIGNGANIEINGSVRINNLDDAKFDNNKLIIDLKDDQDRSYKWEIDVKDRNQADSIIEFLKNKSNKLWKFHDLKNAIEEEMVVIDSKDKNQSKKSLLSPLEINSKQFNKHQFKLELQASLVSLLMNNNMTKSFTTNLYKAQERNKYSSLKINILNKSV